MIEYKSVYQKLSESLTSIEEGMARLKEIKEMDKAWSSDTKDLIREATITVIGDPSVGIRSFSFMIRDMSLDLSVVADEDREDEIAFIREQLAECFSNIYDSGVSVRFDIDAPHPTDSDGKYHYSDP